MSSIILKIYKQKATVFSTDEIAQLFPDVSQKNLNRRLNYLVKTGKLISLRKGFYAKSEYSDLELANKLHRPSYISFQTVLKKEGLLFQETNTVYIASYLSRRVEFQNATFSYHKLPDFVLVEDSGVKFENNIYVATKERAFLDTIYLFKDFYVDNIASLDWDVIESMKKIYNSKKLIGRVDNYYKTYNEEEI